MPIANMAAEVPVLVTSDTVEYDCEFEIATEEGEDPRLETGRARISLVSLLSMSEAERNAIGFATVEPEPPTPPGQRVVGRTLVKQGGKPVWNIELEPVPLAELKASKRLELQAVYDTKLAVGFPHTFTVNGETFEETLQCRNEHDRTNWIGLLLKCQMALSMGAGEAPCELPLRVTSNANYQLTYNETFTLMVALLGWAAAMLGASFAHKDAIDGAADAAALAAIDLEAGWPS